MGCSGYRHRGNQTPSPHSLSIVIWLRSLRSTARFVMHQLLPVESCSPRISRAWYPAAESSMEYYLGELLGEPAIIVTPTQIERQR